MNGMEPDRERYSRLLAYVQEAARELPGSWIWRNAAISRGKAALVCDLLVPYECVLTKAAAHALYRAAFAADAMVFFGGTLCELPHISFLVAVDGGV